MSNYSVHSIVAAYMLSHVISSPRAAALRLGIDNNISPRDSIARAEKAGKIKAEDLDRLRRNYGAHSNAIEHLPLYIAGIIIGNQAQLPAGYMNRFAMFYLADRAVYLWIYLNNTTRTASLVRSVVWWIGNILCFTTLIKAGNKLV